MNAIDIIKEIRKVNEKIDRCIFKEQEIPKELKLQHNKLMCDYNEQVNKGGNGK